ncbi:TonB-dependent receptor [Xylanibacter oryzae]|uniref:TonB-dependent receptor n=1 Tax=Xylanibacter oryzae TaxID=185293 RepID=UPI00055EC162|nr:TonB-dependent receptor [Xylanibacter oryzae]
MKNKYILLFLFIISSVSGNAKIIIKGCIYDENNSYLIGATVSLFTQDSIISRRAISDSRGNFIFDNIVPNKYRISISYIGYEDYNLHIENTDKDLNLGNIQMQLLGKTLKDVVITGNRTINKIDRKIILPTTLQTKSSTNGVSLLQHLQLSGINVNTMDNTIKTSNGEDVQLRINDVQATIQEVKAIQPTNIIRVEYHDMPGLRYNNVPAVIDFIVKYKTDGGSVSGDLANGVSMHGIGNYELSSNYHNKGSELKAVVDWVRRDLKWTRENYETFVMQPNIVHNDEIGEPTKIKYDYLNFSLGYNYTFSKSMFSVTFRNRFYDTPNSTTDRISKIYRDNATLDVTDFMNSKENSPSLDLYYQTEIAKNKHIYVDLVSTYINSKSDRTYSVVNQSVEDKISSVTQGDKYTLIGEGIYEWLFNNNKLSFGLKHSQMYTKNTYEGSQNSKVDMNTSETYAYGEFMSKMKDFTYTVGVGAMRTYNNQEGNKMEKYIFRPTLSMSYNFSKNLFIKYNTYISGYSPSLSDLSNVSQDIDIYQTKRGNPNLKSVTFLSNALSLNWNIKGISVEFNGRYSYDDKPIMEETTYEGGRIIRTMENQKSFHRLNTNLNIQIQPFGDWLSIQMSPYFNRFISYGNDYTHTHSNWGFDGQIQAMYKSWLFMADAKTSYHTLWGETIQRSESGHSLTLGYKLDNWCIQMMVFNPFTKTYKIVNDNLSKLAPYTQYAYSKDLRRVLMLDITFNLNYGTRHNSAGHRISNKDEDSGIMHAR